ncbi:MAG TPA: hypothetical protein ENJ92_00805 [Chloroflexi bacterium]|nr:hypothetical protein [Chloroflexota bacterium]
MKRLRRVEAISSQIRNEDVMEDRQIKRPSIKILSDELLERIVEEAKDVLEQTGVMVYGRINHR